MAKTSIAISMCVYEGERNKGERLTADHKLKLVISLLICSIDMITPWDSLGMGPSPHVAKTSIAISMCVHEGERAKSQRREADS